MPITIPSAYIETRFQRYDQTHEKHFLRPKEVINNYRDCIFKLELVYSHSCAWLSSRSTEIKKSAVNTKEGAQQV